MEKESVKNSIEEVRKLLPKRKAISAKPKTNKSGTCTECGRVREITNKTNHICGSCYHKKRLNGTLRRYSFRGDIRKGLLARYGFEIFEDIQRVMSDPKEFNLADLGRKYGFSRENARLIFRGTTGASIQTIVKEIYYRNIRPTSKDADVAIIIIEKVLKSSEKMGRDQWNAWNLLKNEIQKAREIAKEHLNEKNRNKYGKNS